MMLESHSLFLPLMVTYDTIIVVMNFRVCSYANQVINLSRSFKFDCSLSWRSRASW